MIERDLRILLAHVSGQSQSFLLAHPEYAPSAAVSAQFEALRQRYHAGEPLAYLLGEKGFWKYDFKVNAATLIPRPETELLLELALEKVPPASSVIELGVGSGCLGISLALERPDCNVLGVDISHAALALAQENADCLHVQNIRFVCSDWFEQIPAQKVEAIISNPPYIRAHDPHLEALRYEPVAALVSGKSGLEAIELIIQQGRSFLRPDGFLALEHGYDQAEAVQALFCQCAYREVETRLDLQGHPRVTLGWV